MTAKQAFTAEIQSLLDKGASADTIFDRLFSDSLDNMIVDVYGDDAEPYTRSIFLTNPRIRENGQGNTLGECLSDYLFDLERYKR